MSTNRKSGWFVAFGLAAAFALSIGAGSASAHHHHRHRFHHHGHYHHAHFHSVTRVAKPIVVPVLYYDCFGRPYYVWTTKYGRARFGF